MRPPHEIDGAKVLEWAWSDTPFGYLRSEDGVISIAIHGLAICQYAGSSSVYRFSCDGAWKCEQDAPHASVEEAKQWLPEQYREAECVVWRARSDSTSIEEA